VPNTLCHIGLQSPLNRFASRTVDLRLVIIGCIIPDLPWILLSVLVPTNLFNPYDLRLYCTAQASFFFSTFFCLALAALFRQPHKVASVLIANCLLHLILDAAQIKWGNGVNLLAPFDWQFTHYGLTWPEHPLTQLITVASFLYILLHYKEIVQRPIVFAPISCQRLSICLLFLSIYLVGPLPVLQDIDNADTYYLHTMRQVKQRQGKTAEFDRVRYNAETREFKTFAGEHIKLQGSMPKQSGRVSLKGYFLAPTTFYANSFHLHRDFRDAASYVGLIMACTLLAHSLIMTLRSHLKQHTGKQ